jgi:hypothetical protein
MRRWVPLCTFVLTAVLSTGLAHAQTDDNYENEDRRDVDQFALAVGAGLVDVDTIADVENYLTASLRIRVSGRGGDSDGGDWRGRDPRDEGGVAGYIEPEIGYWEASGDNGDGSDLLVGLNLVGAVPLGAVDSFFGVGAGVHFIDSILLDSSNILDDDSETKLGANAHFGLDIYITEHLSAFGVGRFDLVQGSQDDLQSKVYLGLRARF